MKYFLQEISMWSPFQLGTLTRSKAHSSDFYHSGLKYNIGGEFMKMFCIYAIFT